MAIVAVDLGLEIKALTNRKIWAQKSIVLKERLLNLMNGFSGLFSAPISARHMDDVPVDKSSDNNAKINGFLAEMWTKINYENSQPYLFKMCKNFDTLVKFEPKMYAILSIWVVSPTLYSITQITPKMSRFRQLSHNKNDSKFGSFFTNIWQF